MNEGVRYMYDRAEQERDAKGEGFARWNYEWIFAYWRDQVRVIQVKGTVVQIELLSGKDAGRRLWVHADEIGP